MVEASTELPLILLAEDDHTIAYVVQRVLEDQQRFRVTWVKDGEAALEAAEEECPALFLLDLSNPDLNWADIARGMGLQASTVETVEALDQSFAEAMAHKGPSLIEVML